MQLQLIVNDKPCQLNAPANRRLIDILREDLRLTGTKEGCGIGECGACTIIMDGVAVNSCLVLACQLQDKQIITIEQLANDNELSQLQQNFLNAGAVLCGFCTPGMLMSAKALLLHNPHPTEEEIRVALSGNICRCSGYSQIIEAVTLTAENQ